MTRVPESTDDELKDAVKSAQGAFPDWKNTRVLRRQQIMFNFMQLICENWDRLAASITLEQGKTFADARGDVLRGLRVGLSMLFAFLDDYLVRRSAQARRDTIIREIKRLEQPVHAAFGSAHSLENTKDTFEYQSKAKKKEKEAKAPSQWSEDLDLTNFEPVAEPMEDVQKIPATCHAIDVLPSMYLVPLGDARTIDWGAFVHAMGNLGFSARHNAGSAVIFEQANAMAATKEFLASGGEIPVRGDYGL
ncbi:hypothetical protein DL764_004139 [Monosporascus ibericus]|uniref:Aldehyde dehydrogenase domain-containing protein n=1 Tax=Monosporascus ibericus TaxID=155417 RepID=A0A4Q4THD7_9PEZI|nr:hypothetical protein DL764_004139 [Monosporascus ibericus]